MHERLPWRKGAARIAIPAGIIFMCAVSGGRPAAQDPGSSPSGTPATAWDQFREGERRSREGDLKGALEIFGAARRSLTAGQPVDRSLADALSLDLYNLAAALTSSGDADSSLACFKELFRMREKIGPLRDAAFEQAMQGGSERIADYAVSVGKAALAIPIYRARLGVDPAARELRLKLAAALLSVGSFDDMRKEVEVIRKVDPRAAETWAFTGRADLAESKKLMADGAQREARVRWEWGVADFRQAIELDTDSPARLREHAVAAAGLAVLLDEEGDYAGADAARAAAIGSLAEARKGSPGDASIDLESARMQQASGRLEAAAAEYARATLGLEKQGAPESLRAAREERFGCLATLAGDSINQARFADARALLGEARPLDPSRSRDIDILAALLEEKSTEFERIEKENAALFLANPGSATPLRALCDLYASYARYDEAWKYLEKIAAASRARPPDAVLKGLAFRIRSGSPEPIRKSEVEIGGRGFSFVYAREESLGEIRKALPAAWQRSAAALGSPPGDPPLIKIFANQRALRESGLPRVGAMTDGLLHRGLIAFYAEPRRSVDEWTSVIARGVGMWEAARLSRGRAPAWLVRGVGKWIAGDGARSDRPALARAAADGRWIGITALDQSLLRAWNDPARLPLLESESLALVESLERARGSAGVRALLAGFAAGSSPGLEKALAQSAGMSSAALEASARAALPSPAAPAAR